MNEPVYFLKLELENVRCFGEKAQLDLSDGHGNWRQWTVILGDNGTGKTTLLQCISSFDTSYNELVNAQKNLHTYYNTKFFFKKGNRVEFDTNFPATVSSRLTVSNKIEEHQYRISGASVRLGHSNNPILIYGYGANRLMNITTNADNDYPNSETLFNDDAKLINAEEWLKDLELAYATSTDKIVKEFIFKRKEDIKQALIAVLPGIQSLRLSEPTAESQKSNIEFLTPYGYWVSIQLLSLGYKTMVVWMVDLISKLFARYPDKNNPLEQPAIVLVDEIDLHLHPKWQRDIFGHLSKSFPLTQFVITAHSPLVVQSAPKDANIVVLRKEGDHVVIDNDVQSVHNWRLDQILSSDLFGGIPSRNPDVEKDLERRKLLIQKQFLSPEEEAELEKLNKKADKIPQAESEADIEAKEIIRKAAEYYRTQGVEA